MVVMAFRSPLFSFVGPPRSRSQPLRAKILRRALGPAGEERSVEAGEEHGESLTLTSTPDDAVEVRGVAWRLVA